MGTISYTIPQAGTDLNSVADPEIATALTTLKTLVNGNIDGANVVASLTGRRLIGQYNAALSSGLMTAAGNYTMPNFVASGGSATGSVTWWHLDQANFAVVGKGNTQLIMRMALAANGTPPGITFQGSLNAITLGSATGAVTITAGAVQGSAITFTTPAANSESVTEVGPFTFPNAGLYAPILNLSGAAAANSGIIVMWQLYVVNS